MANADQSKRFAICALAALLAASPAPAQTTTGATGAMTGMRGAVKVTFAPQNNSGETGVGYLMADGTRTKVMLALKGAPSGAQPVHIHPGTCAKLGAKPAYSLSDVVNGKSNSEIDVPLAKLLASSFAINVHGSASEMLNVSCADISAGT
jgi:hypothetical protein